MKRFLINVLIVFLAGVAFLTGFEILARQAPDSIRYKYNWMKEHSSELETLVLGPSNLYMGVRPSLFETKGFNAAFSGQHTCYDWMMMTADTVNMTKLKNVILMMGKGYYDTEQKAKENISYELYVRSGENRFHNFTFELQDINRCKQKVKGLILKKDWFTCDKDGSFLRGRVREATWLNSNSFERAKLMIAAYKYDGKPEISYYEKILDYCHRHGIRVIAIYPPVYSKFKEIVESESNWKVQLKNEMADITSRYDNYVYHDYSGDDRFDESDFNDSNHLNVRGGCKLTMILKEEFNL